jgi:hypothetical protein
MYPKTGMPENMNIIWRMALTGAEHHEPASRKIALAYIFDSTTSRNDASHCRDPSDTRDGRLDMYPLLA